MFNSFVYSVHFLQFLSFLQLAGVLFAACISFAFSVHILLHFLFYLQCARVLFAVCNSFACSVHFFFTVSFLVCSVG